MTKYGKTATRLIRLIEKGGVSSQACAAGVLGVSRQRVNQIIAAEGLTLGKQHQPNIRIKWPCPSCGTTVKMWTSARNGRKTAFCRPCSRKRPDGNVSLVCQDCGKTRLLQRSAAATHKSTLCRPCWIKRDRPRIRALGKARLKEYCIHGHLLAETRRRWANGKPYCLTCNREGQ